jgi:hypothetical protein
LLEAQRSFAAPLFVWLLVVGFWLSVKLKTNNQKPTTAFEQET